MALLLSLQDFTEAVPEPQEAEVPPDTLPGYAEGYAAGMSEAQNAQAKVDARMVQALEDIAFGFAEARQMISRGLSPLFEALVEVVLPAAADPAFRIKLVQHLCDAAHQDMRVPVNLILNPQQVAPVQELLKQLDMQDLSIVSRADQPIHAALIERGEVETALDADAIIDGLTEILNAYFDIAQEHVQNG